LRVLETMEFSPVGSADTVKVDVRVLCATNRDLQREVEEGNFRDDLYHRINVVPVELPSLRERPGDIAVLATAFIDELASANGRPARRITIEAIRCLERYAWPGNVRELRNSLEQVIVLNDREEIRLEDLPDTIRGGTDEPTPATGGLHIRPGMPLKDVERAQILQTMEEFSGNRPHVSEVLGISLRTLQRKLKEYGLTREG
jgi:DNA-binding NtrC family response regulator